MRPVLIAALALLATPVFAEDELEMAPALPATAQAPAATADVFSSADMAVAKSVAKQVAQQYRLTPEKRAELSKLAAEQKKNMAPHMKAMGKAMEGFANDPKFKADMQRFAKDMQGMMARQLPQMLAAMQPMIQEALPQLLEAQAKALRTLTLPTPVDPYEDQ
jgi:hypothetical protein